MFFCYTFIVLCL